MLHKPRLFAFIGLALAACQTTQSSDTVQQAPPEAAAAQTAAPATEVQVASAATPDVTAPAATAIASAVGSYEPRIGARLHYTSDNGDSIWEYKGVVNNLRVLERIKGRHVGDVAKYTMGWDQVSFESDTFTDQYFRPSRGGFPLPLVPGTSYKHTYTDNRGRNNANRTNTVDCDVGDYVDFSVPGLPQPLRAVKTDCTFNSDVSGRTYHNEIVRDAATGLFLDFAEWRSSNPNRRQTARITLIEP